MARTLNRQGRIRLAAPLALAATLLLIAGCSSLTGQNAGTSTVSDPYTSGVPYVGGDTKVESPAYGVPDDGGLAPEASRTGLASPSPAAVQKLIVVNKTMRIETAKVDEAILRIRELVARDGAEITAMQVSTVSDQPIYRDPMPLADGSNSQSSGPLRAYVTVRVPAQKYTAFIADAAKLGTVLTESENSEDVTQQHVDMKARLGNLTAEQGRLRQLFAKATNVKDMLAVEQELTRVQGEIESMQAQVDYLERQAAMATVTLELSEPKAIVAPAGIDWGVQSAFTDSIRAFVGTMNILIVIVGPVLALLVFVGLPVAAIAWLVVRAVRRRRAVRASTPDAPLVPEPVTADEPPIL